MMPPTDDQVTLQLQKLVDRCRHGATYCKRVLSLYQLSKVTLGPDRRHRHHLLLAAV